MSIKHSALLASLILALSGSFAARAEDKPVETPVAKPAPTKKQIRHDHAAANKQATESAAPEATAKPKKPLHDHQKFHK